METHLWFLLSLSTGLIVAVILLFVDTRGQRAMLDTMRRRVAKQDREVKKLRSSLSLLLPPDSHPTPFRSTEEEEQRARVRLRIDADDPTVDAVEEEELEDEQPRAARRRGGADER
jgi:hypothetical protein